MAHRTAQPAPAADLDQLPPDIATMRASVRRGLVDAQSMTDLDELATLADTLRGHMRELMPSVQRAAAHQHRNSVHRYCALACLGEARRKLQIGNGDTRPVRIAQVQRLARSLNALCDHYETLSTP